MNFSFKTSDWVEAPNGIIDADVANDPDSTANTAVPAEFAGFSAVERFIGYLGRNRPLGC